MKPLSDTFRKNGFNYVRIMREGNIALYAQRLKDGPIEKDAKCLAYEVFKVKQNPDYIMAGTLIPAHESAPGNEEFGRLGWSFNTLERAKAKFNEMVAREKAGKE